MSIDVPAGANFTEDEDDEWLYGETNGNDENSASRQLTGALAESKLDDSAYDDIKEGNVFIGESLERRASTSNGTINSHFPNGEKIQVKKMKTTIIHRRDLILMPPNLAATAWCPHLQ